MKRIKIKLIITAMIIAVMVVLGNIAYAAESANGPKLESITITPEKHNFHGFNPNTRDYTIKVPSEVDSVNINAVPEDGAKIISGTGTKDLKEGYNKVTIKLQSNTGKEGNYILRFNRAESKDKNKVEEEKKKEEVEPSVKDKEKNEEKDTEKKEENTENTENIEKKEDNKEQEKTDEKAEEKTYEGLASLNIIGVTLTPEFNTNVYEYQANYTGTENKVDVKADVTNPQYSIEVMGNEDLKDGNNTITIVVSDPDEKNIATYQILLNKELKKEVEEKTSETMTTRNKVCIIVGAILLLSGIISIIAVKVKKGRQEFDEYSMPYGLNEDDEDYEENLNYDEDNEENNNDAKESLTREEEKEKIKREFLNNYNQDEDDIYKKKGKYQGKRYK